jgi:hypothetical protein
MLMILMFSLSYIGVLIFIFLTIEVTHVVHFLQQNQNYSLHTSDYPLYSMFFLFNFKKEVYQWVFA